MGNESKIFSKLSVFENDKMLKSCNETILGPWCLGLKMRVLGEVILCQFLEDRLTCSQVVLPDGSILLRSDA